MEQSGDQSSEEDVEEDDAVLLSLELSTAGADVVSSFFVSLTGAFFPP